MARRFETLVLVLLVASYGLILVGGYTRASESGLGCGTDWPTCEGRLVPALDAPFIQWVEYSHRVFAGVVLVLGVLTAVEARRSAQRDVVKHTAYLALFLLFVQAGLGAATVATELSVGFGVAHLAAATAYFGAVTALAVMGWKGGRLATGTYPAETREAPGETAESVGDYLTAPGGPTSAAGGPAGKSPAPSPSPASPTLAETARDYADLVKPGILLLLVVAGFTAMLLAGQAAPAPALIGWTLLGGGAAAGAASVFNNVLDRRMDERMHRTRTRPLPADRVPTAHALVYGTVLAVLSVAVLWTMVNLLTALFALGGIVFYVLVYTAWLKPTTPQNIVIGGAAGGFPALVGWAAVTGDVGLPAVVLAMIVVLWTPPHFWALAIFYKEDYARADVPMMPVVAGVEATKRQMVAYSVALVAATLVLVPLGVLGTVYLVAASVLGAAFIGLCVAAWREEGRARTYAFFKFTIAYLFLLFVAMVADKLVAGLVV